LYIGLEAERVPEPIWTAWKKEKSLPQPGIEKRYALQVRSIEFIIKTPVGMNKPQTTFRSTDKPNRIGFVSYPIHLKLEAKQKFRNTVVIINCEEG
jgi:hypothetical protein